MIEHHYNYLPCTFHQIRVLQSKVKKSHFWPCIRENLYILVCTGISWYISWHTVTQHPLLWIKPNQPSYADAVTGLCRTLFPHPLHLESWLPGINVYRHVWTMSVSCCHCTMLCDSSWQTWYVNVYKIINMYIHICTYIYVQFCKCMYMYIHGMCILPYKHICTLIRRVCTCLYHHVHVLSHINMYI